MAARGALMAAMLALSASGAARAERCLDDRLVLAPAGPWHLAINGAAAIGVFYATFGRAGLSVGRRFLDRLEVELSLNYNGAGDFDGHEETVRVAVLLHLSRRWELSLGWRVGHARFHRQMYSDSVAASCVVASVSGELRLALTPSVALRLSPVVFTGYWNEIWGFTMDPTVGVAYRF